MRFHRFAPLGLLLLASAVSAVAHGQFEPINKAELDMTSDPKAPGAAAVYLERIETTDDPHHFATIYARIKVLTEQGKKAATVRVANQANFVYHATGDNSSRMGPNSSHWDTPDVNHAGEDRPNDLDHFQVKPEISALQGRTIHSDGTIVPLTGNTQSLLHVTKGKNGTEDITFNLPDVEVGSVLEYRYQIRYDRFEGAPDWQIQKEYPARHARFSFTPDERFSQFRNKGGAMGMQNSALLDSHNEAMTDIGSGTILPPGTAVRADALGGYSFEMNDVPAFPTEAYATPAEGQAYRVSFYYLPSPDEKDFWQRQMSFWSKALDKYTAATPALDKLVKELTAGSATQSDKAKKLYAYTEKLANTDFSTDGEPENGSDIIPNGRVDKVIDEKKGTSNEIAYLYLAMARMAGLNARPERIASRSRRIFSTQFRQTGQLDTVVIALKLDGKEVIVDPGTYMAPFGTLHWAHCAAGGVAMGESGKVETIVTPPQNGVDNVTIRLGTLNVSPTGQLAGTLKIAFIGQRALQLRQLGAKSGEAAVEAEINKMLATQAAPGVTAKLDHVAYLNEPGKQLLAVVPVSGTLNPEGGRLKLPRNLFSGQESNPFPEQQERKLTVDVHFPEVDQEKITYELPEGFEVAGKPEDAKLNWEGVGYSVNINAQENKVTVSRVLARGFTLLEAGKYTGLRDFYQKVLVADQQNISLSQGDQASAQ